MVFCVLVEKVAPFLAFWFGFVVVVVVFAFELVHILDIVQNVDIDGGNVSVLDCEDVAVSDRIVVWKFISVGIEGYHEAVAVGAFFVKFIYVSSYGVRITDLRPMPASFMSLSSMTSVWESSTVTGMSKLQSPSYL